MALMFALELIPAWIVIIIGLFTFLYFYFTWNFGFLEKQGVRVDKPWPVMGSMHFPWIKPMEQHDIDNYKKYGRIYGMYESRNPALHIGEPDLIRQMLVKDFNVFSYRRDFYLSDKDIVAKKLLVFVKHKEWKNLRAIISPTFSTGKLKQMIRIIDDCSKNMVESLQSFADREATFETKKYFMTFTLDIISQCAFGIKIESIGNPQNDFVKNTEKLFNLNPLYFAIMILAPKLLRYCPPLYNDDRLKYFSDIIQTIIKTRKENDINTARDFIQLLMDARNEDDKSTSESAETKNLKKSLSFEEILAQSLVFLFAGYETTASALSFLCYCLALHPDIQEKLISQIDTSVLYHKGELNYESINEMQYLDMVISEVLRLYPPTVRIERTCEKDGYELGGITLRKGNVVGIPIYCIHRDPEFYPSPEVFDPDRFSPEQQSLRNPYIYLPFGFGPRNCIGIRFALMEIKIAIIALLKNYRIKKCPETMIPLEYTYRGLLMQPKELRLSLETRKDAARIE